MTAFITTTPGSPTAGFFSVNDTVTDPNGVVWMCVKGGFAGPSGLPISSLAQFEGQGQKLQNTANVGTVGTGVTAVEYGEGFNHVTVLTVNTVLPAIAGGASLGVGNLIYTLPAGVQLLESAYISMAITQTTGHINANTPVVGLGTVVASGVISVLSGTATFQNIAVGTAAANCTGTATVFVATPTASPFTLTRLAGDAKTVFFNSAAAWAASGDPAAILAGTVVLQWSTLA